MIRSHSVACAHDDCDEWSHMASFQPVQPEQLAARHRAGLADEGWTDLEGRDYCPQHTPSLETQR